MSLAIALSKFVFRATNILDKCVMLCVLSYDRSLRPDDITMSICVDPILKSALLLS